MSEDTLNIDHGLKIKAWEQQEGESVLHYTYFRNYLDLGPQRSIVETIKVLVDDPQILRAPKKEALQALLRSNKWAFRAELYDRHALATQTKLDAEKRKEELRISLEEYAGFQKKMGRGLSALAAKVLAKTTDAVERSQDSDWDLQSASRFMAMLNQTATTAAGLWSDSLGVDKLNQSLAELDSKVADETARLDDKSH